MSHDEVDALCESLCDIIGEAGICLDSVAVPGFGTFESRQRSERVVVNPTNGVRMLIPPKVVISFRPSAMLRKKVRESGNANISDKGKEGGDE